MACWERVLRTSVFSCTRPAPSTSKAWGEQRELGVRVHRRPPHPGRVGGAADLQAGVTHRHVEVGGGPDGSSHRQPRVRGAQAHYPRKGSSGSPLLQALRDGLRTARATGQVLPHPIVIQGFKQLLRVALRDGRNDFDETTGQPDVRWGWPGHHRPGHGLRSSIRDGDEPLVLGLGRAHPRSLPARGQPGPPRSTHRCATGPSERDVPAVVGDARSHRQFGACRLAVGQSPTEISGRSGQACDGRSVVA